MGKSEKTIVYFDTPGEDNTDEVLRIAKKRAEQLKIKQLVVASTRGEVGIKAAQFFKGYKVIVVTHHTGFKEPGLQELTIENRRMIEQYGGTILTGTHVFMNVERAIKNKFGTVYASEIIAQTLRFFGEGMKVAVEIVAMAADAGLIAVNQAVLSLAGTGKGLDTAVIIQPANSTRIFEITVKEIVAKPSSR